MTINEILKIDMKECKEICDEILEFCDKNVGKKFVNVIPFAKNKYEGNKLLYSMFLIGYIMKLHIT